MLRKKKKKLYTQLTSIRESPNRPIFRAIQPTTPNFIDGLATIPEEYLDLISIKDLIGLDYSGTTLGKLMKLNQNKVNNFIKQPKLLINTAYDDLAHKSKRTLSIEILTIVYTRRRARAIERLLLAHPQLNNYPFGRSNFVGFGAKKMVGPIGMYSERGLIWYKNSKNSKHATAKKIKPVVKEKLVTKECIKRKDLFLR